MIEATCARCGETFIPADATDLIHAIRETGEPCGGQGEITRAEESR